MAAKSKITRTTAKQWIGKPVYIELIDGSSYIGWVTGAERGQLVISGRKSPFNPKMTSSKRAGKARVSSFLPGMIGSMLGGGSLFGGGGNLGAAGANAAGAAGAAGAAAPLGGGGGGGFGGLGGIMGFMGKAMPMMKMGFGMIRTIIPMLQGFKL
ncbi:hypothetical protein D7Z26_26430 [Cohnella endophytica]|uniref:Uncharacterized protein n=1 Tax=Cohnella endophytica TaxID=2419778 RepID=A0A494X260_9BACL|nr:hypothetical protein [Cohnella endophytica]RKP44805.1 hypothetical protein D7Z26_26430 [Cohnella endophytica]